MSAATVTFRTPACILCHRTSELTLDAAKFKTWQQGGLIQVVFPELSADQRELMITGIHPSCWNELFGDDEPDDPDPDGEIALENYNSALANSMEPDAVPPADLPWD